MKNIISTFFLLFVLSATASFAQKTKNVNFNYSGSNWEKYNGHRMTMVVLDTVVGGTKLMAEQVIKDGTFKVSGSIANAQNAFFGMYNPNGDFVYKQEFILEPGKLIIDRDTATNEIVVSGGKYNMVFNQFNKDPEYLAMQKAFVDYSKSVKQDDFKDEEVKKKYTELQRAPTKLLFTKYNEVRFNNADPLARLLAIYHSDRSIKYEDQLNELEEKLGNLPEIAYLRYNLKLAKERNENKVSIVVGSVIKDFTSKSFKGESFQLTNVLKQNKYTLVEFWASWCGPCRGEIPHMKVAYNNYHMKGFEIVSFTLDHEGDRWEKASTDEKLPWINVGDLLAYKSPVVKMFGINGIPANYLVDPSGKIIAMNLRQEKLDDMLASLLNDSAPE